MGQKVNPVGFRLGVNRGWDSVWYAKKRTLVITLSKILKLENILRKMLSTLVFQK